MYVLFFCCFFVCLEGAELSPSTLYANESLLKDYGWNGGIVHWLQEQFLFLLL